MSSDRESKDRERTKREREKRENKRQREEDWELYWIEGGKVEIFEIIRVKLKHLYSTLWK
jgi:hypothetical protein